MEAIKNTPSARKLGLLDVLVGNWDRAGNWLRDGDQVYGYDHAEAFHPVLEADPRGNPFVSHFLAPGSGRSSDWTPNDLSRTELDRWRAEIVALRPLSEKHAELVRDIVEGPGPLGWHADVLARLDSLREHATRP